MGFSRKKATKDKDAKDAGDDKRSFRPAPSHLSPTSPLQNPFLPPTPAVSMPSSANNNNNNNNSDEDVTPPLGPPPSYSAQHSGADYTAPPPQHDWASFVPDTSLFPPPPDIFSRSEVSPANNASADECAAGDVWCARYPMSNHPLPASHAALVQARNGLGLALIRPAGSHFQGSATAVGGDSNLAGHIWELRTAPACRDTCFLAWPPLYAALTDSPLVPRNRGRPYTAYFEVVIRGRNHPWDSSRSRSRSRSRSNEVGLAIGFAAPPYPDFRLPGWHRGSLAVHGDDGHRYVNDAFGGRAFTAPFGRGQTVGIGMTFSPARVVARPSGLDVDVFFTHDGRLETRWDLFEETDAARDLPVAGLEGGHDLLCAVGLFGEAAVDIVFEPARWAYRGSALT